MEKGYIAKDDSLREYTAKRQRRRMIKRIFVLGFSLLLAFLLIFVLFRFLFVVREIKIEGVVQYAGEDILSTSGIQLRDNIFSLSEEAIEKKLCEAYPYIKALTLTKEYPDVVTLTVEEEYTTFSYEMLGEYFLFNRQLRLMDKFDSFEALSEVRVPIIVDMPLPKSCIVPQYIQLQEGCDYVPELISMLCDTPLVSRVTKFDLSDKFVITMEIDGAVTVAFGDTSMAKEKFSALLRLLASSDEKMTGTVDLSDYPRCFYDLKPQNAS